jgi:hypothetical protein
MSGWWLEPELNRGFELFQCRFLKCSQKMTRGRSKAFQKLRSSTAFQTNRPGTLNGEKRFMFKITRSAFHRAALRVVLGFQIFGLRRKINGKLDALLSTVQTLENERTRFEKFEAPHYTRIYGVCRTWIEQERRDRASKRA